ncbi:hypothetical protein B484DRAFT_452587 [Ochromonadaceae sp. CCMP2298]|nr:hypothetical protein B484DRAFT_452587 [Ochromonadaceae sp. CCMP2298]
MARAVATPSSLGVVHLLLMCLLFCAQFAHSKPIKGAEAIQGEGETIKYLLVNGTRHLIPDSATFQALGLEASDVKTFRQAAMKAYPLGDQMGDAVVPEDAPTTNKDLVPPPPTVDIPYPHNPDIAECPCRHSSAHDLRTLEKLLAKANELHVFCVVKNEATEFLQKLATVSATIRSMQRMMTYVSEEDASGLLNGTSAALNCTALIRLIPEEDPKQSEVTERQCPGICLPIPYLELPAPWLLPPYQGNRSLSCSLTLGAVLAHQKEDTVASTVFLILRSVARRRMEECLERGRWPLGSFHSSAEAEGDVHSSKGLEWSNSSYMQPSHSKLNKRKVYGLVIWVGTNSKLGLLRAQTQMLSVTTGPDHERIFGWSATEDQYGCYNGADAKKCGAAYAHNWMMPSTKMSSEASSGWGCAQRRPLRAMSHTLSLYDPDFLFVVDDDTWVNIPMLLPGTIMHQIINKEMRVRPLVLGQLNGGNKITKKGFFYGGAGYLMGRGVLDSLNSFTLVGPDPYSDTYRDQKHLDHLGMMEHAYPMAAGCPDDCMTLDKTNVLHFTSSTATLRVPLVDICTNTLSDEGTCYHSDHAISRCLVHGVYADVWDVLCQGFKTPTTPSLYTQMCMGTGACNVKSMLTCHRWQANTSDALLTPQLIPVNPEASRL